MTVLFRRGVSAEGHATMPKFTGSRPGRAEECSRAPVLDRCAHGVNTDGEERHGYSVPPSCHEDPRLRVASHW